MDTRQLALFADVARRGSFTAAAAARHMDPSTLSRAIAQLEAGLGVRLFQRSTRRLSLTEAGQHLLERALPLAEELDRVLDQAADARRGVSGTLRLTASVSFGQRVLVPLLADFRAAYPRLRLECVFTDANLDLLAERIDLAVRLAPTLEGGDLVASRLMQTRYRVVASPAYLARAPKLSAPEDLAAHACLVFDLRAFRTHWRFRDAQGNETRVPIDGAITLSPALALREAALAGLGPALLPGWLIDEDIAHGNLVDVFPGHAAAATTFDTAAWLVYPSRSFLPMKVRAMVDYLRARLA